MSWSLRGYRGRIGSSGCTTPDQLRKTIKKTLRERGVTISVSEILVTVTRHRFEAVMSLPVPGTPAPAPEGAANDEPGADV